MEFSYYFAAGNGLSYSYFRVYNQMKNTKLYEVLESFGKERLDAFEQFLASPYFNSADINLLLLKAIRQYCIEKDTKDNKQKIYAALYKKEAYDDNKLRRNISKLFKLVEHFIAVDEFQKKDTSLDLAVMAFYSEHKLADRFLDTFKELNNTFDEKNTTKDKDYFYNKYILQRSYVAFQSTNNSTNEYLKYLDGRLDDFYLLAKFENVYLMLNEHLIYNTPYDDSSLEPLLAYFENNQFLNRNHVVNLYYRAVKTYYLATRDAFNEFKQLFYDTWKDLSVSQRKNFIIYIKNILVKILGNQDSQQLYREYHEINKIELESGDAYREGYLAPMFFRNAIQCALQLDDMEWVQQFLEGHKEKIAPEAPDRTDYVHLCYAMLYLKLKQFEAAWEHILEMQQQSIMTDLEERKMRIKLYMETKEYSLLESEFQRFRTFLSRKTTLISESNIQMFRDYNNVVEKLYKLVSEGYDEKKVARLLAEVQAIRLLTERDWILEKIALLGKRR
jgi:hypothetical protein